MFTVHAECYSAHAFRTAIKLTRRCYQGCAEGVDEAPAPDIHGNGHRCTGVHIFGDAKNFAQS